MESNWVIFPSDLDGNFTLFSVDAGLWDETPLESHGHCQIVTLAWGDGFPDSETGEKLDDLEEWLSSFLEARMGIFVGRITSVTGLRQLFYYVPESHTDVIMEGLMARTTDIETLAEIREDADWAIYREFLYPTPLDWRRINNHLVVRQLAEHGDLHEIARPVDHYAYFENAKARDAFAEFTETIGFTVDTKSTTEEGAFALHLVRSTPVTLDVIDEITTHLFVKADEFGGIYDGWGCPVVTERDQDN